MEYYSATKKNEIMPFAEIIILSTIRKRRQIPCDITHMWNLKYNTNQHSYENKQRNRLTDTENRLVVAKGSGQRREGMEFGQTIIYRMDKQKGHNVQHRELYSIFYDKS